MKKRSEAEIAGFGVKEWCARVGISRALFYCLPSASKPRFTKVGDRVVIFEHPTDWLSRMAALGGVLIQRKVKTGFGGGKSI